MRSIGRAIRGIYELVPVGDIRKAVREAGWAAAALVVLWGAENAIEIGEILGLPQAAIVAGVIPLLGLVYRRIRKRIESV